MRKVWGNCPRLVGLAVWLAGLACLGGEPPVTYKGREVSAEWVKRAFAAFGDKIACLDGKFYDIGQAKLTGAGIMATPPELGEARQPTNLPGAPRRAHARIIRLLEGDEAIAVRPAATMGFFSQEAVTFHVKGIDPQRNIDGTLLQEWLIYQGVRRNGRSLQSYRVYQPLTKTEFVAALRGGFELVQYRLMRKKVPRKTIRGTRIETVEKVVSRPVP